QVLGRILKPEPQWIDYQGERVLADLLFRPRDGLLLPKPAQFVYYISTGMVPKRYFGHEELARIQFLSLERVFCLDWPTVASMFQGKYQPFDMSLMPAFGSSWSFGYVAYQNKVFTIPVMIGMTGKREGCAALHPPYHLPASRSDDSREGTGNAAGCKPAVGSSERGQGC